MREPFFAAVLGIPSLAPAPRKPANPVSPASGGPPFHHGGLGMASLAAARRAPVNSLMPPFLRISRMFRIGAFSD